MSSSSKCATNEGASSKRPNFITFGLLKKEKLCRSKSKKMSNTDRQSLKQKLVELEEKVKINCSENEVEEKVEDKKITSMDQPKVVIFHPQTLILEEKPKPSSRSVKGKLSSGESDNYVGFANLPNQVYFKAVKRGFEFTLMVVGASGLGKSTLINSLFLTDIYNSSDYPGPTQRTKKTVSIEMTRILLKENAVKLSLTLIDTPGFGDDVDNTNCWDPIIKCIDNKMQDYLVAERKISRVFISDQRIHCCLYFIQPTGHGLKPLDIQFLKNISDKVNVIPIIAKADTLTAEECTVFKKRILNEILEHDIKLYEFPDISEEDEEYQLNKSLKERVPFAVVGSNILLEVDGKKVRGRKYPWGVINIENLEHCDFTALRKMVICTHLQDLIEVTNNIHYENYRRHKLNEESTNSIPKVNVQKHESKIKDLEVELEKTLQMEIRDRQNKLKKLEVELTRKHEITRLTLQEQAKELEERRRKFLAEKEAWYMENVVAVDKWKKGSFEWDKELGAEVKKEKKKRGLF